MLKCKNRYILYSVMIPLLIVSDDIKLIDNYVNKLKADQLFFEITPETKEYSIADIKNLKKEAKISNPKVRLYYLPNFHLSSIPAQNSFLKLLEEPPVNIQFVLSTDDKNRLLPTVISRVKVIKLLGDKIKSENTQSFTSLISNLVDQKNQTTSKIPLVEFKLLDKDSAKNILGQIIAFFRERLDSDKKAPLILKEALRLNSLLKTNNLNPQLTVDHLLIFIYKQYKMKIHL